MKDTLFKYLSASGLFFFKLYEIYVYFFFTLLKNQRILVDTCRDWFLEGYLSFFFDVMFLNNYFFFALMKLFLIFIDFFHFFNNEESLKLVCFT